MVAPGYSAARSAMAQRIALGRKLAAKTALKAKIKNGTARGRLSKQKSWIAIGEPPFSLE